MVIRLSEKGAEFKRGSLRDRFGGLDGFGSYGGCGYESLPATHLKLKPPFFEGLPDVGLAL